MRPASRRLLFVPVWMLLASASSGWAGQIYVLHSGSTDPATEGFGGGQGSATVNAWNFSGSWCCTYDRYYLSGTQISQLNSATNWDFRAVVADLSPATTSEGYGPDTYGTDVQISLDGVRFDLDLHSGGSGNQVLSLNPFAGGPDYTILGLGTNYVTLDLLYNTATHKADAYVNGNLVITGFGGHGNYVDNGNNVVMGSANGNVRLVQLQTDVVGIGVPEPGSMSLLTLAGLAVLGLSRKKISR